MRKTNGNLILLNVIFVVALVTSNVVTAKLVATGIMLGGSEILLPGAVLCYALTFLMTDVIGEIWGREEANRAVRNGFFGQLASMLLITLTAYVPAADTGVQDAYMTILGQNWMFTCGSMLAYVCSQSWDVYFFHKLRDAYVRRRGSTARGRWIWNNASTMTSQIIDTVIFIGFSFGVGYGWLFDAKMLPTLFGMMAGQYIFKFILAACDTPFFYLLTRRREESAAAGH